MPEGHDTAIDVSNIMSFVLYTQILKQSVLKPASPRTTLIDFAFKLLVVKKMQDSSLLGLLDYKILVHIIISHTYIPGSGWGKNVNIDSVCQLFL